MGMYFAHWQKGVRRTTAQLKIYTFAHHHCSNWVRFREYMWNFRYMQEEQMSRVTNRFALDWQFERQCPETSNDPHWWQRKTMQIILIKKFQLSSNDSLSRTEAVHCRIEELRVWQMLSFSAPRQTLSVSVKLLQRQSLIISGKITGTQIHNLL